MNLKNLTVGERFIVEYEYDLSGSFKHNLAEAIFRADTENLNKLRKGFPDEVIAVLNYRDTPGWWEDVKERAGIV